MNTMLVVSQPDSARALIRWGARFAQMRGGDLLVFCCLFDGPVLLPTPVDERRELSTSTLVQKTKEAVSEVQDMHVQVFAMRHPSPAKIIIQNIQERKIAFLCVGADSILPLEDPVSRMGGSLLHFAPCDALLLDTGDADGSQSQRILVPMGIALGTFALQTAVDFARKMDCRVMPLEVGSYFGRDSRAIAQRSLTSKLKDAGIEASRLIEPTVTLSGRRSRAIMNKSRKSDLLLLGATSLRSLRKLRHEETRFLGPEGKRVSIGLIRPKGLGDVRSWFDILPRISSLLPTLGTTERIDLFDRLHSGARLNVDFIMMICLSTAIASLGLMQNSTAVVIGAMVVAPLMTPLIGAGLALIQGNLLFFRDAIRSMAVGIGSGFLISVFFGLIVPLEELTPELLARGAPTAIDLVVAFLSGAAAAYAMSRPTLVASLAGVAIAAALVPPLSTVGIALTHAEWDIACGAAILFITNLVAIILGAASIYRCLDIHGSRMGIGLPLWVRRIVILLILLSVILAFPLGGRLAQQLREGQTRPNTIAISQSVRKAIADRVRQEPGINFISASRFGIEHEVDVVILLGAEKRVPAEIIPDLKKVVNDAIEEDVNVAVYVFEEVGFK